MKIQLITAVAALWSCRENRAVPFDSPWSQLAQVELLERALQEAVDPREAVENERAERRKGMSSNMGFRSVQERCLHIAWSAMILGVVLVAVGSSASLAQTADGNGIFNPGFEKAGPLRWRAGATAATVVRSATLPHSGDASLRVADQSQDAVAIVASEPNRVLLQGGGRFYAEAWMRVDNAAAGRTGYGSASLDVVFYTADGTFLSRQNVGTTSSAK